MKWNFLLYALCSITSLSAQDIATSASNPFAAVINPAAILLPFEVLNANFAPPAFKRVDGLIIWNSSSKLSWENFNAQPDDKGKVFVCSTTDIVCMCDYDAGTVKYQVYPVFNESESWVKEGARTSSILTWQQLSFDLTALYAYKLLNELNDGNYTSQDSVRINRSVSEVKFKWYCKKLELWQDMMADPDNIDNQLKWARYVSKELVIYGSTTSKGYCTF